MQESSTCSTRWRERATSGPRSHPPALPTPAYCEIFQRLVQEQISIRDLRASLEALVGGAPREKDTVMLTEYVRSALEAPGSATCIRRGRTCCPRSCWTPRSRDDPQGHPANLGGRIHTLDRYDAAVLRAVTESARKYTANTQKPRKCHEAAWTSGGILRRLIEGEH